MRTERTAVLNTAVVGAGQFGLGVSYYLKRAGVPHRVLERGRIAESWRTKRWDSFRMNTPNAVTILPGSPYDGPDPEGFMTTCEFIGFLESYAARHRLPVETDSPVLCLNHDPASDHYRLVTPRETILARNVVIAGGAENQPRRPEELARMLSADLRQLHSAEYRSPAGLPEGAVLVVGSASSGVQIAADLINAGRKVYLATCRVARLPRRHRGRDMLLWRAEGGFLNQTAETVPPASRMRQQLAAGQVLSLQVLAARGVVLLGRLTGADGQHLTLGNDLEANIRFADEGARTARAWVDDHIDRTGVTAPPAELDPAELPMPPLPDPPIRALDLAQVGITSVIWCTGFGANFDWVELPVFDARGSPMHERGAVTACPGLFFIGLPWLSARKSALVYGVTEDAERIAGQIAARH